MHNDHQNKAFSQLSFHVLDVILLGLGQYHARPRHHKHDSERVIDENDQADAQIYQNFLHIQLHAEFGAVAAQLKQSDQQRYHDGQGENSRHNVEYRNDNLCCHIVLYEDINDLHYELDDHKYCTELKDALLAPEDTFISLFLTLRDQFFFLVFQHRLQVGSCLQEVIGQEPISQEKKCRAGFIEAS